MRCVADLMSTDLLVLPAEVNLTEAMQSLERRSLSGAPVVDAEGRGIGVFTIAGLNAAVLQQSLAALQRTLSEVMTPFVFSVKPGDGLLDALKVLVNTRIHRVVIMDESRIPLGILTTMDLLKALHANLQDGSSAFDMNGTFSLRGGYDAGVNLVSNLKLFSHLANVGDTRSLVIHPASTTHSQLDDEAKVRSGAAPDVVRLSIGIEDKEDLIADLEQALEA